MKAVVVSYLSQHPFFLVSLAGVCIGVAASCVLRRRQRRRRPVVFRRRCRVVTPLVLTAAVAVTGAAFLTDAVPLLVHEWRSAAILAAVFGGAACVVIVIPGLWRLFVLVPLLVVVGIPMTFWNPTPEGKLAPLHKYVPMVALQDDAKHPADISLALLRVRQVPDGGFLEIAMLPTTALLSAGTEAAVDSDGRAEAGTEDIPLQRPEIWPVIAAAPPDATVRITVETMRTAPALWWFPPSGLPVTVTVDVEGDTELVSRGRRVPLHRYPPESIRASVFTRSVTTGLLQVESAVVRFPREGDGFLQPGLYPLRLVPDRLIPPGNSADSQ